MRSALVRILGGSGVYVIEGVRTPFGKFGRSLRGVPAVELGMLTAAEALHRAGLEPRDVDVVIYGHVIRGGTGMNTARQVALKAGVPERVEAITVDMVCASGLYAACLASTLIEAGVAGVALAGGMESMSSAPFLIPSTVRWGVRFVYGDGIVAEDSMVADGLRDPLNGYVMGVEADEAAREAGARREDLDVIGLVSHLRAAKAWRDGVMGRFVIPVEVGGKVLLESDEGVRPDTSLEKLRRLRPAFGPEGLHTAGTSSQLSDGAASIVLAGGGAVEELGLRPKARLVGWSAVGCDPRRFCLAPAKAVKSLLNALGWDVRDVDYWENHQAFAISDYVFMKELGVSVRALNLHGGAIAVGHPLGASGARALLEAVNVLETRGLRRAVVSVCHGLGGAVAVALELT